VQGQPVGLGLGPDVLNGAAQAAKPEDPAPRPPQGRQSPGFALVQPDDGRSQRLSVLADIDHGGTLGGQGHAGQRLPGHGAVAPQLLTGIAQGIPEHGGVLLGPARMGGDIGLERDLGLGRHLTIQIEHHGFQALGTVVDSQYAVAARH
jgi:hypothetical protein